MGLSEAAKVSSNSLSLWVKVNGWLLFQFIGGLQKQAGIELGGGWWVREIGIILKESELSK